MRRSRKPFRALGSDEGSNPSPSVLPHSHRDARQAARGVDLRRYREEHLAGAMSDTSRFAAHVRGGGGGRAEDQGGDQAFFSPPNIRGAWMKRTTRLLPLGVLVLTGVLLA